jgi:hypothetical protein
MKGETMAIVAQIVVTALEMTVRDLRALLDTRDLLARELPAGSASSDYEAFARCEVQADAQLEAGARMLANAPGVLVAP